MPLGIGLVEGRGLADPLHEFGPRVRGQPLDQAEQVAYSRQFGPLDAGLRKATGAATRFEYEELIDIGNVALDVPGATRLPVVVAALGPVMLKIAGELADGTNTWMVGPKTSLTR